MSTETALVPISEPEYEAIEAAVMETARGRWFLKEYARRNRQADTDVVLEAIEKLEKSFVVETPSVSQQRLGSELAAMAKAIQRVKSDIAASDAEGSAPLAQASEVLDGIIRTTERATSDILEAAEQVQEAAWTLREDGAREDLCTILDQRATDIYTACSFQDLTAQRTARIIKVLRYLEGRIHAMIDTYGYSETVEESLETETDEEQIIRPVLILHEGLKQEAIDAVVQDPAEEPAAELTDPLPINLFDDSHERDVSCEPLDDKNNLDAEEQSFPGEIFEVVTVDDILDEQEKNQSQSIPDKIETHQNNFIENPSFQENVLVEKSLINPHSLTQRPVQHKNSDLNPSVLDTTFEAKKAETQKAEPKTALLIDVRPDLSTFLNPDFLDEGDDLVFQSSELPETSAESFEDIKPLEATDPATIREPETAPLHDLLRQARQSERSSEETAQQPELETKQAEPHPFYINAANIASMSIREKLRRFT
jgi:chemotaxis regulatin CheY-phosphate phosphatase CheZ